MPDAVHGGTTVVGKSQFVIVNIVMGVRVVFQNENERTKIGIFKVRPMVVRVK